MKKRLSIATLLIALSAASPLLAADTGGIGFSITNVKYQEPAEFTGTVTMRAIGVNSVGEIAPGWNYEAMLFTGLQSGEIEVRYSTPINISIKRGAAVYLRPSFSVGEKTVIFSRLGYSSSTLEATYRGAKASASESGASFGVGIDFTLNPKTVLTLDFTEFLDKDGVRVTGLSLGSRFKF
jgi:hypothetical protein